VTLRHRKLERALRGRTKAHLRMSESQWLEHKRLNKGREYQIPPWLYRGGVLLAVMLSSSNRRPVAMLTAVGLLWSLGSVLLRAHQLRFQLYGSPDLQVLGHLPIADQEVFRLQFKKFLRTSLWSAADFSVLYGVLAFKTGFGSNALVVGLAMGSLQWLTILALAVSLFACARKRPFLVYAQLFMGSALGLRFFGGTYQTPISNWLAEHAFWFPPMGWTLHVLGINRSHGLITELWPALSIGIALLLLPMAYQRIRGRYVLGERVRSVATLSAVQPAKVAHETLAPLATGDKELEPAMVIRQSIRTRDFLKPFDWKRAGWLERLAFRWFTPEERLAAEFITARIPRWTIGLVTLTLLCGGGIAAVFLIPSLGGIIPIFAVMYGSLALSQNWKGFENKATGGSVTPLYAAYPLPFGSLYRVLLKVNLLRLALPPMVIVLYVLVADAVGLPSGTLAEAACKASLIFLAVQPVIPIIPFSVGTNDVQKPEHLLFFLIGIVFLVGIAVTLYLASSVWTSLVLSLVLTVASIVCAQIYRRAYERNWFDLMSRPKTKTVTTNGNE
jgi:hypothetical protein